MEAKPKKKVVGVPFKKGNPDGRAGRRFGSIDKWRTMTDAARQQLADKEGGLTPLQFLLSVLRQDKAPLDVKFKAASIAAPYMHRKMPIAIEGTGTPLTFLDATALAKLNKSELNVMMNLLSKIGALPPE